MRINLNIADDLLEEMDAYCAKMHITRTGLISLCASQYLQQTKAVDAMPRVLEMLKNEEMRKIAERKK